MLRPFVSACRYVCALASRKAEDRHLASWERNYWRVVRARASEREIHATNASIERAEFDRAQDERDDAAIAWK